MSNPYPIAVVNVDTERTVAVCATMRKAKTFVRNMWFIGRMNTYKAMQGTSALDWVQVAIFDPVRPFPRLQKHRKVTNVKPISDSQSA